MNKQISIWKGTLDPPTIYHLWEKDDSLYYYDGTEWMKLNLNDPRCDLVILNLKNHINNVITNHQIDQLKF